MIGWATTKINGRSVESVRDIEAATAKVSKGKVLRLLIQRRDTLFYTTLRAE